MNSTCCASSKPKIINERKRSISACVCVCEKERERDARVCVCVYTAGIHVCLHVDKRKPRKAAKVNTFDATEVCVFLII